MGQDTYMVVTMVLASMVTRVSTFSGGYQFVFAIPEPHSQSSNEYYLHMYISATRSTNIAIEAPAIHFSSNTTIPRGTTVVPLNARSVMLSSAIVEQKGISIQSDRMINVYVINHEDVYSDGFLVLPLSPISSDFIVSSYIPQTASEFTIASMSDNTDVDVTVRMKSKEFVHVNNRNYYNGHTFRIRLNRLDAMQIKHQLSDLTGTVITSNKPIAVTSGNMCAQIPQGTGSCDYLVEQMPPVKTWKTKYIIASLRSKHHLRFRIVSSENSNRVTLTGTTHSSFSLSKGDYQEFAWEQDLIVFIEATYPVLAVQYNERLPVDNSIGDPFMMTIPSFDHFTDQYYFTTPTRFDSHHGSVIVQTTLAAGLRLNGQVLSRSDEKRIAVNEGFITHTYSVIRFDVSFGNHHLTHINVGVNFGMLLYGFKEVDSYGLPLSWNMNCQMINGVRLTNNTSSKSGIVEMLIDGVWAPVCYGGLDRTTARVICRTLGYDKYGLSKQPFMPSRYPGRVPAGVTSQVSCSGLESSITGCGASYFQSNACHENVTEINCAPSLEEIVQVSCTPTSWRVTVDMDKLRYRFPGSVDSDIYLGKNTCTGTLVGHDLVFNDDIHSCLTSKSETSQDIVFSNQLVYAYHDPTYTFIIRSFNWTMDLRCHIPRDQSIHSNITYNETANQITTVINSTNQYAISTQFYLDPNFSQKLPGNPINQPTGTNVFAKSFVSNVDWNMKMRLNTCYTTSHGVQYYLIKNGCEVDANTHILSQTDHETKFVFQIFEVTGRQDDIYIKCDATMCDTSDPASIQQCDQNCRA